MTKDESEFVLMCAVDYVIARHTYAPKMLVGIITEQWSELSENTQKYIYTAVKRNYFDCDTSWHKILAL